MGKNKKIIFYFVIMTLFVMCNRKSSNTLYTKDTSDFYTAYKISNVTTHFPEKLKTKGYRFFVAFPTTSCISQKGDLYLIVRKSNYQKELDSLIKKSIYTVKYSNNNNTIIDLSNLKRDTILVEKCNTYFSNTKPIPYFEDYNFNLGYKTVEKKIDGNETLVNVYTLPEDLKVYVINAEAGDFWKKSCDLKRPKSLKEWQHGYSRGIAVSDKENLIVYWTMLW